MKPTLLIVDDERGIVDTMKAYFSPQYEVLTARRPSKRRKDSRI